MWCYKKPGFEALLLAELQRQQQSSQFCDTLLKAEGVSVPAHSWVLSALSPHVSSALSSTPAPPAGQSRLLEFRALGARTLLRVVGLLYSGEMAGEGEEEKREAISAAAHLGIRGLVEVTRREEKEGGGRRVEVGVQTEPTVLEESKRVKWRREVMDGCTLLWKETQSVCEKDTWTQNEELQDNTAPSAHFTISVEAMDTAAEQTDSQIVPSQIPYIPMSLLYPPGNQIHQPPSASATFIQDSAAAERTSGAAAVPANTSIPPSLQPSSTPCAADLKGRCTQAAATDATEWEEWQEEQCQQFQGNIPGFMYHFFNQDKEASSRRGRAAQRRGAEAGRARRARAAERRAGGPRASTGGRRRGRLTQTVDVQEVGVSAVQKLFLQRWGRRSTRTGQGGGAAGRKLCLKTRASVRSESSGQRRTRGKLMEFSSQSEEMLSHSKAGGGRPTQHGQRTPGQRLKRAGLRGTGTQRPRAKSTYSSAPARLCSNDMSSSPHFHPAAASYMPSAAFLLHTTSLPPPPQPPPHEDQPEQIDRLLEEVMMGLEILPQSRSVPASLRPRPTRGSGCSSSVKSPAPNKQQVGTAGLLGGFPWSAQVAAGTSSSAQGEEAPVLQQQGDGEMTDMLDHFLQSFEQHVENVRAQNEEETNGGSSAEPSKSPPVPNKHRSARTKTKTPRGSRPQSKPSARPLTRPRTVSQQGEEASAQRPAPPQRAEETSGNHRRRIKRPYKKKRRKGQYLLSLERPRARKPAPTSEAKIQVLHELREKQLRQIPVVKLERRCLMPVGVTLQGHSCQHLDVKSPSSEKLLHDSSEKNGSEPLSRKSNRTRSRFRGADVKVSVPLLIKPHVDKPLTSAGSIRGRSKETGKYISLRRDGSSEPVQPFTTRDPRGESQDRHGVELTVRPQEEEEEPTRRGKKRRAEAGGEMDDNAPVAKMISFEPMAQPTSETCLHSSEPGNPQPEPGNPQPEQANAHAEEVIDVESVSPTGTRGCLDGEDRREIKVGEAEESGGSAEEAIDVDGDTDGGTNPEDDPSAQEGSTGWTGSGTDEDVDVIGESSPLA